VSIVLQISQKKRLPFSYGYLALFAPILEDPSEQAMRRSYETKKSSFQHIKKHSDI